MSRAINFGAGPAMLPEELLKEIQQELLDWQGLGMSILEIGHRTAAFTQLLEQTEQLFRTLLNIPADYHVLFLGGATRAQFGMIPLNFLSAQQQAGYVVTGIWSAMALKEAQRLKKAYCLASSETSGFTTIPSNDELQYKDNTAYLYYTPNETVNGVRYFPVLNRSVPIIADMTSCLLTEPVNIADFDMIFAGAQKIIANAGLTIVIVSNKLLNSSDTAVLPTMSDYRIHAANHSLYATPPTFNCYVACKMLQWIEKQGGVAAVYQQNRIKSARLYQYIDSSSAYECKIAPQARSLVNVCFNLASPELESLFAEEAAENNLLALKGHRMVGGLRVSLYNSMPISAVDRLINFMDDFARKHRL
ncbi:3-phosphoserine/phosphohydroxythreonine transaminase [Legionella dresdenensis]|uniref:Phosphoserine aminotransferase n=1 Tax=Legionella dresdenensis TaxID=450200 RepID=A0ABV8CH00_9GAMM